MNKKENTTKIILLQINNFLLSFYVFFIYMKKENFYTYKIIVILIIITITIKKYITKI